MSLLAIELLSMIFKHKQRRLKDLMLDSNRSQKTLFLHSQKKTLRMRQTCQILKLKQRQKRWRRLTSNLKRIKDSELKQLIRQHHHCQEEFNVKLANKVMIFVPVIICSQTKHSADLSQISRWKSWWNRISRMTAAWPRKSNDCKSQWIRSNQTLKTTRIDFYKRSADVRQASSFNLSIQIYRQH